MINVEVFFSDKEVFDGVMLALWKKGVRFTKECEIDDGAYQYTITEYNCDASVIVNALNEFFNANFE